MLNTAPLAKVSRPGLNLALVTKNAKKETSAKKMLTIQVDKNRIEKLTTKSKASTRQEHSAEEEPSVQEIKKATTTNQLVKNTQLTSKVKLHNKNKVQKKKKLTNKDLLSEAEQERRRRDYCAIHYMRELAQLKINTSSRQSLKPIDKESEIKKIFTKDATKEMLKKFNNLYRSSESFRKNFNIYKLNCFKFPKSLEIK